MAMSIAEEAARIANLVKVTQMYSAQRPTNKEAQQLVQNARILQNDQSNAAKKAGYESAPARAAVITVLAELERDYKSRTGQVGLAGPPAIPPDTSDLGTGMTGAVGLAVIVGGFALLS